MTEKQGKSVLFFNPDTLSVEEGTLLVHEETGKKFIRKVETIEVDEGCVPRVRTIDYSVLHHLFSTFRKQFNADEVVNMIMQCVSTTQKVLNDKYILIAKETNKSVDGNWEAQKSSYLETLQLEYSNYIELGSVEDIKNKLKQLDDYINKECQESINLTPEPLPEEPTVVDNESVEVDKPYWTPDENFIPSHDDIIVAWQVLLKKITLERQKLGDIEGKLVDVINYLK